MFHLFHLTVVDVVVVIVERPILSYRTPRDVFILLMTITALSDDIKCYVDNKQLTELRSVNVFYPKILSQKCFP